MVNTTSKIITTLNKVQDKFDAEQDTGGLERNQDVKEKQFCSRVDTAYQIVSAGLTLAASIVSTNIPPLSIAIACLLVVMSAIHYYDKKNNYEFSHGVVNIWNSFFNRNKVQKINDSGLVNENNANAVALTDSA